MITTRHTGYAPKTAELAREVSTLTAPCIGCADCQGVCECLLDALRVPQIVLKGRSA